MKRILAVMCVLVAGAYFSANAGAQDWDANCPRLLYDPNIGAWATLENEWQEANGDWTGLYLSHTPEGALHYFEVSPCTA